MLRAPRLPGRGARMLLVPSRRHQTKNTGHNSGVAGASVVSGSSVVTTIPKHDGEEIRATLSEYTGTLCARLRAYLQNDGGDSRIIRQRVTVAVDRFEEFEAAIARLRNAID